MLPPMTETISSVSLNGARSNVIPPGAMSKQNPKSERLVSYGPRSEFLDESLTNMDNVPRSVKHNVSIMAILEF